MRTTLTLDDDVAALLSRLQKAQKKSGSSPSRVGDLRMILDLLKHAG